jgi:Ca2+-binding EF-hand superfamily protein
MHRFRILLGLGFLAFAMNVTAGPPVTSKAVPSPAKELARRWIVASFQSPWLDYGDATFPQSEAVRMLRTVQKNEKLAPGVGWYGPSSRKHDWKWLASRFDTDGNGRIHRQEFTGHFDFFTRLDRDRNGVITKEDFDWSEESPWVQMDATILKLFRLIDTDGDGRIHDNEMQTYFKKQSSEKGYLNSDDLRRTLNPEKAKEKRVSQDTWLKCMIAGDLGSPFEGPRVGQEAPDFTLKTQDGKKEITLSEVSNKKPIVLIFGSFT